MAQQINLLTPILLAPKRYFSALTLVQATGLLLVAGLGAALWMQQLDRRAEAEHQALLAAYATERQQLAVARAGLPVPLDGAAAQQQLLPLQTGNDERRALLQALGADAADGGARPGQRHSDLLALIARSLPESAWLGELHYAPGRVELVGGTLNTAVLRPWLGQLSGHPLLAGQQLSALRVERVGAPGAQAGGNPLLSSTSPVAQAGLPVWAFRVVSAPGGHAMKASTPINLAPLRARWERQAKRIDALSLRERAIVFLSIAAVLAALFDTMVLTPLSARNKLRTEARAQQAAEMTQLREQFVAASSNVNDPAGQLRAQLDAARAERLRLDAELRKAGSVSGGEGLSVVLQRLLARQPGLGLERLALLDDTPVAALAATPTPTAASAPVTRPANMPGMVWQGVELQVLGRYGDIQRYLQALERELPGLRWGEMHLSGSGTSEPPRLRAQLFLLKVQP